jgi:hypothetical protein
MSKINARRFTQLSDLEAVAKDVPQAPAIPLIGFEEIEAVLSVVGYAPAGEAAILKAEALELKAKAHEADGKLINSEDEFERLAEDLRKAKANRDDAFKAQLEQLQADGRYLAQMKAAEAHKMQDQVWAKVKEILTQKTKALVPDIYTAYDEAHAMFDVALQERKALEAEKADYNKRADLLFKKATEMAKTVGVRM